MTAEAVSAAVGHEGGSTEGNGHRPSDPVIPCRPTHFVAGRWAKEAAEPGRERTICDPATGTVLATVPSAGPELVATATAAARRAAPGWARTPPAERAAAVAAWADRLAADADDLARLQTWENGKPLGDSRGGVDAGIAALRQYAELGPLHRGRSLQGAWEATDLMRRVPRGVAAVITPWNDPVAIFCALVAANLVVGNPVVAKPSERTPLHAVALVERAEGLFPDCVLGLVLGDGVTGAALVDRPEVAVVAHVGSVATGRAIAERCGARLVRSLLELGGNDPLIVDEGVDPRWAAEQVALGAFANAGQICTAVERVYVHESLARPFLDALVELAAARRVGSGFDGATQMGPLIDRAHRQAVHAQVAEAVAEGATVLVGGEVPEGPGCFYPPTVLTGVDATMRLMRDETFGPVAPVEVAPSFDEALRRADDTAYGLAATVLTPSMAHAQQAARELEVGTVKINSVFGGAPGGSATPHGISGWGFGYGPELLDELTRVRVVHQVAPPDRA